MFLVLIRLGVKYLILINKTRGGVDLTPSTKNRVNADGSKIELESQSYQD